jgi:dTDP-4-amino-4,6-dideoxygalactose transaminase
MRSSLHLYPVRLKDADEKQRNQVINRMAEGGVSTNVHYKPLPMFTAYKRLGFKIQDFPNAFAQYQNELTLPLHTLLSDDDVAYVADTLKKVSG